MVKADPRFKTNHKINQLPIKTKFYEDESISSWMIRAALNQGCTPLTFTQYYWSQHRLWTRDLDKGFEYFDPNITLDISRLARIDTEELIQFNTLYSIYKQLEYGNDFYKKNTSWIIPLAKRNRVQFLGYQYCPLCLMDVNKQPYLRIHWRFTWSVCCTSHKVLLQNKCPSCGEVYQPQLLDAMSRYIDHCYHCKSILYLDKTQQVINNNIDNDRVLNFQLRAHNVYLNGAGQLLGQELKFKDWLDTILFFLNIIRKGYENQTYMFGSILKEFNISFKEISSLIEPLSINYLSAVTRFQLFSALELMINVTKEEWVDVLIKCKVTQNSFHWSKNSVIPKGFYPVYQYLPISKTKRSIKRDTSRIKSKTTIEKEWQALKKKFIRLSYYEKQKIS